MNNLNKEELIIGFCYGIVAWCAIGIVLAIPVALTTALFWAWTGRGESKLWRRLVNPVILALCFIIGNKSAWPALSIPLSFGAMSVGYGIPDKIPPYDEGSWLGRKFGKYTRLAWFAILAVSMIPLFIK